MHTLGLVKPVLIGRSNTEQNQMWIDPNAHQHCPSKNEPLAVQFYAVARDVPTVEVAEVIEVICV